MKIKNSISYIIAVFIFLFNNFLATICCAQSSQKAFESYYLRSKNFPSFDQLWTANYSYNCYTNIVCDINGNNCYTVTNCANLADQEAQGVTHDDNNWFFAWSDKDNKTGFLFKFPLT